MQVSIILNDCDRDTLHGLARQGPIWLCQSPIHADIAASLRSDPMVEPDHVTVFFPPVDADAERSALYILDTVLQHHPAWRRLLFIGLRSGASIHAALHADDACELSETPDAIIISR